MPEFVSPQEAVSHIPDGACLIYNNFLSVINAEQLSRALNERFKASGHPRELCLYCSAGLGGWKKGNVCEEIVCLGGVKSVVLSHFGTTPEIARLILENKLEAYNLPFGVMSHAIRAAAAGEEYILSDTGLNLFVDPKYKGYQLNSLSKKELVEEIIIDGKRRLKYPVPRPDVAFIKASSCDAEGNISMEDEVAMGDALSIAQATKRRGGLVIVQVARKREAPCHPMEVVIPAALITYICICPEQTQVQGVPGTDPLLSGRKQLSDGELVKMVRAQDLEEERDLAKQLIARRAVRELKPGDVVNIGVGAPEYVARQAALEGILDQVNLTVESGPMRGLPAGGVPFGAAVSPHAICTSAEQFDLYNGGGLDICFIGALEIDRFGNVNGHYHPQKLSGIGGFINITQFTHRVVFCSAFSAGGLELEEEDGQLKIKKEGRFPKFVKEVRAMSFSAENARASGQEVYYITERCVFQLGEGGLILREMSPGIDLQKDILDQLPFEVKVDLGERTAAL